MNDTNIKQEVLLQGSQKNFDIVGRDKTTNINQHGRAGTRETDQETKLAKKILILAANPKTTDKLRLDQEAREIDEGLLRSKYRDRFEIHSQWAVRLKDIRRALLRFEPHIVHFSGYGKEEGLAVEDEFGLPTIVPGKALSGLFKLCSKHVEVVLLSACYSARQATAISRHIKYVIGMRKEIEDKLAIEFAVAFYDALGAGRSVEDAFKFGEAAIQAALPDSENQHLIPVLKRKKKG